MQAPAPTSVAERFAQNVEGTFQTISGDELAAVAYLLAISGYKGKDKCVDDGRWGHRITGGQGQGGRTK